MILKKSLLSIIIALVILSCNKDDLLELNSTLTCEDITCQILARCAYDYMELQDTAIIIKDTIYNEFTDDQRVLIWRYSKVEYDSVQYYSDNRVSQITRVCSNVVISSTHFEYSDDGSYVNEFIETADSGELLIFQDSVVLINQLPKKIYRYKGSSTSNPDSSMNNELISITSFIFEDLELTSVKVDQFIPDIVLFETKFFNYSHFRNRLYKSPLPEYRIASLKSHLNSETREYKNGIELYRAKHLFNDTIGLKCDYPIMNCIELICSE